MSDVIAPDTADLSDHTHVVIDVSRHGRDFFAALAQKLAQKGELPKTMRATRAKPMCGRVIYRLPLGTPISRRRLGEGVVVRGCDANSVLAGYTLANTRPQADAPQWLWDPSRFAELMGQGSAPESDVPPEPAVDQAPMTEATDTAAPLDAGADDAESDTNPANHETNLNKTEAIMANPRKIDTESRSDAPGGSTGKVLSFPDRQGSTKPALIKQPYPSKLEAALDHAQCGFAVLPLLPNSKRPFLEKWEDFATTDEAQIRAWWQENPDYNIGISTKDLGVVDVDHKNGGDETFAALAKTYNFPPTRISKTQSGGFHWIYRLPLGGSVAGGAHKLGNGVDICSDGRQIVAPGSSINGRFYTWQNDYPVTTLPEWIPKQCGRAKPRSEKAGKRLVEEDEYSLTLSRKWIDHHGVETPWGKIDDTASAMAARFYDYAVTRGTCEELLLEWSDRFAQPPMELEDIKRVAKSRETSRENAIGCRHPLAPGFEPMEIPEWPKPANQNDVESETGSAKSEKPILTLAEWLSRDLPKPDYLMGQWLTTTSRVILSADTGLGKSMLVIRLGMSGAAGNGFLHWAGVRPATVLYIDGEMSRRLLKQRLADEVKRLGMEPKGFHALSHEDIDGFAPLNTKAGQEIIEREIKRIGSVDLIIFDNIMSLTVGSMSDEESWAQTLPWIRRLTSRGIGQLWVHHTGHDKSRGYGTSTREWQMDTVIHLDRVDRADTDVSFQLKFSKARERTPTTRRDFAEAKIALVDNKWTSQSVEGKGLGKISPQANKFLDALRSAIKTNPDGENAAFPHISIEAWKNECFNQGLIDRGTASARSLFSKNKRDLIVAKYISCTDDTTAQLLV